MKLTTIALLLFGAAGAWAGQPPDHTVEPGETLGKIAATAGYEVRALGSYNNLADVNRIFVGQTIRFPGRDTVIGLKRPAKEVSCITLGVAPFNHSQDLKLRLLGLEMNPDLTPEEKSEAKALVSLSEGELKKITSDMVFKSMPFRSKNGQVKWVYNKTVCTPEQGGRLEPMRTWKLSTGRYIGEPITCGNVSLVDMPVEEAPVPPAVVIGPEPAASAPPPPAVVEKPAEPSVPPPEVDQVARDYDFDAVLYMGGDKDVLFGGFNGAGYPVIKYFGWGRYALGGGGTLSMWQGGTSDGFRFNGILPAFGLAQKFSFTTGRDVSVKFPMYAGLWTSGNDATGRYEQKGRAGLWCAAADYTDNSREKAGATWFTEHSVSVSYCDPFSQTATHSYDGKEIATPPEPVEYVAGVSAQLIIRKSLGDSGWMTKVQPFAEAGVNKTSPNPLSGHVYGGLRTVKKVWALGVGPHWSNLGTTLGATLVYNAGRDYKLRVQQERWDKMIQNLEALGVATD